MSVYTRLIAKDTMNSIERMMSLSVRGYTDSALGVLNQLELNEWQRKKIAAILQEGSLTDYTLNAACAMKQRIIVVVKGPDVPKRSVRLVASHGQIASQNQPIRYQI